MFATVVDEEQKINIVTTNFIRLEVITVLFWNVMPCILVDRYQSKVLFMLKCIQVLII
jgi:hypothetical protein